MISIHVSLRLIWLLFFFLLTAAPPFSIQIQIHPPPLQRTRLLLLSPSQSAVWVSTSTSPSPSLALLGFFSSGCCLCWVALFSAVSGAQTKKLLTRSRCVSLTLFVCVLELYFISFWAGRQQRKMLYTRTASVLVCMCIHTYIYWFNTAGDWQTYIHTYIRTVQHPKDH